MRMSALAEMLAGRGVRVTGSDREASVFTERVVAAGGTVAIGHDAGNVGEADTVVFTPAVDPDNPELIAARERGLRIVEGKRLLGEMTRGKRLIAIAGTHGKTTTTAMITSICTTAGLDPTAFVGGAVQGDESNLRVGSDDVWVVEADEYDRAFLELAPSVAVVTSLEADHLDLFASEDAIVEAFDAFLANTAEGGAAVVSADYAAARSLSVPAGRDRVSFGFESDADLTAADISSEGLSTTFTVVRGGEAVGSVTIRLPGRHNVANALAAVGATTAMDVAWDAICKGLASFRGVRRRFEVMGEVDGVTVVNDYAHHPTEITATLAAARSVWDGRIVAVFQPHLYSRTRDFKDAFCEALSAADVCWLTDVYPARETPIEGITGRTIADGVPGCHYEGDLEKLAAKVKETLREGDLVVVMGAGSVEKVAEALGPPSGRGPSIRHGETVPTRGER